MAIDRLIQGAGRGRRNTLAVAPRGHAGPSSLTLSSNSLPVQVAFPAADCLIRPFAGVIQQITHQLEHILTSNASLLRPGLIST